MQLPFHAKSDTISRLNKAGQLLSNNDMWSINLRIYEGGISLMLFNLKGTSAPFSCTHVFFIHIYIKFSSLLLMLNCAFGWIAYWSWWIKKSNTVLGGRNINRKRAGSLASACVHRQHTNDKPNQRHAPEASWNVNRSHALFGVFYRDDVDRLLEPWARTTLYTFA